MKNIHLIQTDKPTGLFESQSGVLHYSIMNKVRTGLLKGYHIHITSDGEIKNGDWILEKSGDAFWQIQIQYNTDLSKYAKIILTTDPDLIADGVQAIDDEFSEWFVKNPSCEEVKARKIGEEWIYNADVPQEEPKQETLEDAAEKNYENKTAQIPVPTSHWVDSKRLQIQNFIEGAKSDAARDYWFEQFKK
jgi:hypothetical protein